MKTLLALIALTFSLQTFAACPDITGAFLDADTETVRTITQDQCLSTTWSDIDGVTTLIADGVERVLQNEGGMTAYAKVTFTAEEFVVDIRMDYGGSNDYDLPVRWITSYRIDKFNNLVEKIIPFNEDGTTGGVEYLTFRRVKPASTLNCPDLSGSYLDKSGESVVLSQKGCEEVSVISSPLSHTLTLDNEYTLVLDDLNNRAFGRGTFEGVELVLEVKIEYKNNPGVPAMFLPVRAVNRYSHTPNGDLQEKSTIYNSSNKVLTSTKTIYKKSPVKK